MAETSTALEILKVAVPSLITAAGWIIVFRQATTLKIRDELKATCDEACKTVDVIFNLATEYYSDNNRVHIGILSANIRAQFLLLSHYLVLTRNRGITFSFSPYLIAYRKAIMGDHFETTEFLKQLEIPDRKSDIANTRSELHFRIQSAYIDWSKRIGFLTQFSIK